MELLKKAIKLFAIKIKDRQVLMNSQSGGAFYAIASYFINNGGVVYGCGQDSENDAVYFRIDSIELIKTIQGSKYVQANVRSAYPMIKRDLDDGKVVLFSGTPCYVSAIKLFFEKHPNYQNLYTVDIICHGVPSPMVYHDYLQMLENKKGLKIKHFIFREKIGGGGTSTWKR